MRIKLLTAALATMALISCNQESFKVNVELQNAEGKMIYLQNADIDNTVNIDSTIITNNLAVFKVKKDDPAIFYGLKIADTETELHFFSENHNVSVKGDANDPENVIITASKAQELLNEYIKELTKSERELVAAFDRYKIAREANDTVALAQIIEEFNTLSENQDNYTSLFITKNSNNIIAPFLVYYNRDSYELDELNDFVANFNIEQENVFSKKLDEYIATLQRVDVGQPYLDFAQETPEGDLMSLSQLVGKSKLLLVDFWASWCGPCRAENPNVVAVYNEFHEKGFDVLGVSLDMKKENWIKAIEDDGLIWHNISDLKYWNNEAAKAYCITSIPSNLLLDENGIIIAKDLRGEDLRNKVSEILK